MPTLKQLEDQTLALIAKQKAIVEDDSRPWTERGPEFENIDADVKALLDQHEKIKSVDGIEARFRGGLDDAAADKTDEAVVKSIGEQFTDSEAYTKALDAGRGSRFSTGAVELKATLTGGAGGAGVLQPTYLPGVTEILFQRLTVADLMPSGTTAGRSIIYMKESAVTNAATSVAEGGAKPLSDLNLVQVTENYSKIATALKVSDEMLQDAPFVQSYVNGRLILFVRIQEEVEILRGNGAAPDLTGLLNRSGLTAAEAVGANTRPDAIFREITKIRANAFIDPSGIVMHPTDWQSIRLLKDNNLQYYGGGPFTGAYGNGSPLNDRSGLAGGQVLWGLPVVVTTAMTQGTALVGAFDTCAQVFRKGGVTVEATNSNEDDFLHNLVAIRAEERLALAVYRPAGFGTVTGL